MHPDAFFLFLFIGQQHTMISANNCLILILILVPRARDPFGLHQGWVGTSYMETKKNTNNHNNPSPANVTAAVPTHFNLPDHSIIDMKLIHLELQPMNNASRRKAREAYFIEKGQTLTPHGINRRNEH